MNNNFRNKLIEVNDFLKKEYYNKCRNSIGIYDTPNGIKYYNKIIQYTTSFYIKPEEIHKLGLREVERIQKELNNFINIHFPNKQHLPLNKFLDYMRSNPDTKFKSKKEMLNYVNLKQKCIEKTYKNYFNEEIKHKVLIKEIPKHLEKTAPAAYEEMASYNLKKPSIYYINTSLYKQFSNYNITDPIPDIIFN